jgi:hypothetical protein
VTFTDFGPPTTLTQTIPSYLYTQYADDDSLQAFVSSYNAMTQQYVAWFASGQLANYTLQVGSLLDIVGAGIYGVPRPSLSSQYARTIGLLNTYDLNVLGFNSYAVLAPQTTTAVSDDIYKRIITWNFYKGDGCVFCVPWLKRRVVRFLLGADGTDTPETANTQGISVSLSSTTWTITLITGVRKLLGGAIFNTSQLNATGFNAVASSFTSLTPLANGEPLQEAISAGVLVLPFQYSFVAQYGAIVTR